MSTLTTGGTVQDTLFNTQKAGVPTLVGTETPGQNLTLRSSTSIVKGAVIVDENTPGYGSNTGALQVVGGMSSQHNVSAGGVFMHMPFGLSVTNVVIPYNFGGSYGGVAGYPIVPTITFSAPQSPGGITASGTAIINNLAISATSGSGSVATLTFPTQPFPPFIVGQMITVYGLIPTGYNGTYFVTSCSTTQVQYSNTASGSMTSALGVGNVNGGVVGVAINNPGTGYTAPPTVTFSDPTPSTQTTSVIASVGATVAIGQIVKAYQTSATTTGFIYYYQVTSGGQITSIPTFSNGSSAAAGPTMTFIGAQAQGTVVTGYSGSVMQGCYHEVGSVYQVIMNAIGSGYNGVPQVTFSPPQVPGGRTAQGVAVVSLPWTASIATGAIATNGSTWTVTTSAQPTSYVTNSVVTLSGLTPVAYNGTYIITGVSTTQFTIANIAQPGAVTVQGIATIINSTTVNNILITDPGSGYLTAPTVTIQTSTTSGSGAIATAVIGNPGIKPIVSTMLPSVTGGYYPNTYYLDFGLTGPDTAFLQVTANSTIYFDNIAGTLSGYINTGSISTNGSTWTVTTGAQPVPYIAGQQVMLQGLVPVAYNGIYTVAANGTTTSFTINNSAQPGAVTTAGLATILPSFQAKGFPQGRKVTLFVKNVTTSTITITLPNLNPANTSTGTSQPTISVNRTAKFEFNILTNGNFANDVYMTTLTS